MTGPHQQPVYAIGTISTCRCGCAIIYERRDYGGFRDYGWQHQGGNHTHVAVPETTPTLTLPPATSDTVTI